tara:strand:+ start:249 stop:629 length:381 start_codon:yes stop_codon:yes gene_type:complete
MEVRKLSFGTIRIISKNLIHFCYNKGIEVGEKEIENLIESLKNYVVEHGKVKVLLEVPPTTVTSLEAIAFLNQNKYKNENTLAVALVAKSIAQRINLKFYHTKVDNEVPTQFFKTVEEAFNWLEEL